MTSSNYRFHVGEIECVAMSDGTFSYPIAWAFSNVSTEQAESKLRGQNFPTTQVETPYTCLLVKTGKQKLLVDTGADGLAPTTGNLLKNLQAEGVSPEKITDVVLTHGHPDHIGGALDASGRPAFPNARYVMSRTEWDFWHDPSALHDWAMDEHMKQMVMECAQKNLPPLKERIELIDGEKEIVSGVLAIPAPGHTPGHIALLIASSKTQLLHLSDAVFHPLHLENPGWRNVFDLNVDAAVKTRQRLFDRAVADDMTALAYHFPFPGLGRVKSAGSAFRWEQTGN
jgi:glyoxylase-like metal-dependent hydrolase (beta-lactamase superfamily II)